ncbi:hypothetical protein F2Q70_00008019 [Brassica cretica]|uniref:Uncharacterized protein n=1 Tax=Brassica cretica TaxID=69181 RepID=A0A8S9M8M5_BRACR|nr:hypothetical protein F2Q68_00001049 [Brassica cretica]KAF2614219.1 hypothetical protein F2Q70_00008019 [Brassica cretica]
MHSFTTASAGTTSTYPTIHRRKPYQDSKSMRTPIPLEFNVSFSDSTVLTFYRAFSGRFVRPDDLPVSRLAVDDLPVSRLAVNNLHGSVLVNTEMTYTEVIRPTTYTEVVRPTTYIEVVHDFIPRFWSNLAYLGRLPFYQTTSVDVVCVNV